jgi:hypothetical protein
MELTEDMMLKRSKLMMASADILTEILQLFGQQPKSTERLKLVMEADKLFMAEMEGEVAGASLMAFKQSLAPTEKQPAVVKKENETDKIPLNSVAHNSVKVHKDFKFSGQIDSKSGISYTNLIRQIEAGLKKGHSQDDIIDLVIRAVIPSSSLRSYLDGQQDMSLSTLRGILRAHYAEKNSTVLYTELASSVQSTKETSSEFLIRSMDLRNKILFASQENSDELKYSPDLVHKLFSRTVQTGLRDQVLRQEMKTILTDNTWTDADLLDKLNKIVRRENENKQMVGKTVVAAVKCSEPDSSIAELVKEMKALKMDVAQLKDTAHSEKSGPVQGCASCREQNRKCHHCWLCGASGHQKRNCRNRPQSRPSSTEVNSNKVTCSSIRFSSENKDSNATSLLFYFSNCWDLPNPGAT